MAVKASKPAQAPEFSEQPGTPPRAQQASGRTDRIARKLVQVGFLLIFLYPLVPVIYRRATFRPAPVFTSWLLPWDPLLLLGHLIHRDWSVLVIGAPLLLLALTLVLGRAFCGWVCPIGAVLDLVRPLAFWQKSRRRSGRRDAARQPSGVASPSSSVLDPLKRALAAWLAGVKRQTSSVKRQAPSGGCPQDPKARSKRPALFPAHANSPIRYYVLAATLAAAVLSLQAIGLLDPLVVFHRTATALTSNAFALQQRPLMVYLVAISFVFLSMIALELWQPRFWCRNLCPLGALLGLLSRWSLLNRRVSTQCNNCGECRRVCTMNAIPRKEAHNTDYAQCTFCLACESACPNTGISFGFGALAGKTWERTPGDSKADRLAGRYVRNEVGLKLSRRELLGGLAAGAAGLAVAPALRLPERKSLIRPPGALPEDEFVRTCILCQECVRVCPTGGLKPALTEGGIAAMGTPRLVPRQGGCALNSSCPHLCAQVCPVGAIRPIRVEQMKVGLAQVDHSLCLAWDQGVKCLVCVEACIWEAAQAFNGRVTVDPQKCAGCGRCENACPIAGSAIQVKPLV